MAILGKPDLLSSLAIRGFKGKIKGGEWLGGSAQQPLH